MVCYRRRNAEKRLPQAPFCTTAVWFENVYFLMRFCQLSTLKYSETFMITVPSENRFKRGDGVLKTLRLNVDRWKQRLLETVTSEINRCDRFQSLREQLLVGYCCSNSCNMSSQETFLSWSAYLLRHNSQQILSEAFEKLILFSGFLLQSQP